MADQGNHRIQKLGGSGFFLSAWGDSGSGDGEFVYLVDVALSGTGGWRTFVFGVLLMVLFLYFREGIVPEVEALLSDRGIDLTSWLGERPSR